jgi:hypothetical protein
MKKNTCLSAILIGVFLLFAFSCSLEKRHYTKGYSISWNKNRANRVKTVPAPVPRDLAAVPPSKPGEKKIPAVNGTKEQEIQPATVFGSGKETKSLPGKKDSRLKIHPSEKGVYQLPEFRIPQPQQSILLPEQPKQPDETDAIIALVFAISGFVFLGLIGSIVGLVLANKARKKIAAEPDKYGGKDLADLARIISLVGIILWCVVAVFVISLLLLFFAVV